MEKLTCPVCGTEFIPQIADHYVAVTDNAGSGLSLLAGSAKPEPYYDAFDPQSGYAAYAGEIAAAERGGSDHD